MPRRPALRALRHTALAASLALLAGCSLFGTGLDDVESSYDQGQYAQAALQLREILPQHSNDAAAQLLATRINLVLGEVVAAETSLQAAARFGATPAQTAPLLAELLVAKAEYDRALRVASRLGADQAAQAHFVRGRVAQQRNGEFATALAEFTAAQKLAPADPRITIELARTLFRLNRLADALRVSREAAKQAPGYIAVPLLQVEISFWNDDKKAALAGYDAMLAIDPNNVVGLLGRARMLDHFRQDKAALATLETASAVAPAEHDVAILRAKIAARNGDFVTAHRALSGAGDAIDHDPEALIVAGDLAIAEQSPWTAVTHYEKAVALEPDRASHRAKLIRALMIAGDENGARQRLAQLPPALAAHPALAPLVKKMSGPAR